MSEQDSINQASPPRVQANSPELRSAIVVASVHHGNTMKIAQAMADALNAQVLSAADVNAGELGDYDLVGFGSGIYFGRHHRLLRTLIASLNPVPDSVFVYSTAGLPFLSHLFHWSLRRILTKRGCSVVSEFSCRGWDTVGPLLLLGGINRRHPNEEDKHKAKMFALTTAGSVQRAMAENRAAQNASATADDDY